ncbi:hypothetical protein I4U23_006968 [Adineta vaga]|nr:hypothetical protein I4U23_006968 [Adineta vaga]
MLFILIVTLLATLLPSKIEATSWVGVFNQVSGNKCVASDSCCCPPDQLNITLENNKSYVTLTPSGTNCATKTETKVEIDTKGTDFDKSLFGKFQLNTDDLNVTLYTTGTTTLPPCSIIMKRDVNKPSGNNTTQGDGTHNGALSNDVSILIKFILSIMIALFITNM